MLSLRKIVTGNQKYGMVSIRDMTKQMSSAQSRKETVKQGIAIYTAHEINMKWRGQREINFVLSSKTKSRGFK